jgi:RecA-family ATPase
MLDSAPDDGLDELERLRSEKKRREDEEASRRRGRAFGRLVVLGMDDLDTAPARGYLLKGLISPAEISLWVGPPKCGKSFLLLYIAYMLSLGRSVFGRRVKQTIVLYVAAEGEGGIANRIRALRIQFGDSPNFHFIAQPADLLHQTGHLADLKLAVAGVGAQLVVLDTLSRMMAGGDENSPQDMGIFVANVAQLRHDTQAHIAIIHHGTKASNGSTPRGHSSLTGADDALIEVLKLDNGSRVAAVVHCKDDADGDRHGFKLDRVELGTDDDGDPITTLIVTETDQATAREKPATLTDNEKVALRTLDQAMKANGILATVGDDNEERKVARASDWRAWFYREGKPGESQDTKQKAFKRAAGSLLAKEKVATRDDFVWRPEVWS